ncbi:synphilin-1, partial [Caerostris extrusa]
HQYHLRLKVLDSSWNSDEEEIFEPEKPFPDLSPPDVVNSLSETSVPYLDTQTKFQKTKSQSKGCLVKHVQFWKFLNLPSSDGEECLVQKKKLASTFNSEKETEQSSSSSALETFGPCSRRPSSSGSKTSGSHSSSSGTKPNQFPLSLGTSQNDPNSSSIEKNKPSEETEHVSSGTGNKESNTQLMMDNNLSSEPDLIKRGRWQNKSSPRSLKNEISPEEFRETYSRSASGDNTPSTSQFVAISDCPIRKNYPLPKNDPENLSDANDKELTTRLVLLPARRGPPPAPPLTVEDDDEQSQDHSDDISISIQKSSVPASSASRIDSPLRGEENFPLNKSSSASTEMLSALDSSTAGRQSPAPSEVSKTESALSPPSDVSKTESTRYLSQLGKIEESGHLTAIKITNLQSSDEQNIKDSTLTTEAKVSSKHKKPKKVNSDKPWYEFSDEEDVIVPQRYKAVSVSIRSSSEDEGAITG